MRFRQSFFNVLSLLALIRHVVAQAPPPAKAPTTTKIFNIGDDSTAGGCFSMTDLTDVFLSDSWLLLQAAQTAIAQYKTDEGYRKLFTTWLGITFDGNELDDIGESEDFYWPALLARFGEVSTFLNGQGLTGNTKTAGDMPWLYCGDEFAQYMDWNTAAFDKYGKPMLDPTGQSYYMIHEIYSRPDLDITYSPYWVPTLGGYDFRKYGNPSICKSRAGLFGTCFRGLTAAIKTITQKFELASFESHVLLCPIALDPAANNIQVRNAPSLTTSASTYPLPGSQLALDQFQTKGCTLYHEIFHLVDTGKITADPYYGMTNCLEASINQDTAARAKVGTNPDSYMFFSLACWYYQNAPKGMTPVLFLKAGLPVAS